MGSLKSLSGKNGHLVHVTDLAFLGAMRFPGTKLDVLWVEHIGSM